MPQNSGGKTHDAASISTSAAVCPAGGFGCAAYWLVDSGRRCDTASAAAARTAHGSAASGSSGISFKETLWQTIHCVSASSTIAMTANAPQCESFKIFCLVARSRRESTASQTSI